MRTKGLAVCLLGALLCLAAGPGSARFTVTPDGLWAGSTATISYSDPNLAGKTILVEITDCGVPTQQEAYVTIQLDANGNGSATWSVPEAGWTEARFSAPEAGEVCLFITRLKPAY
jgi:hypothetical protein